VEDRICQACARKRSRPRVTRAVDEVISEVDVPVNVHHTNFEEFLEQSRQHIEQAVDEHRNRYGSVRVHVCTTATFTREVDFDVQRVDGHFTTHAQLVSRSHDLDFAQLAKELNLCVENFNARRSGFVFETVTDFVLVITQYRPLSGSSYIPTPPSIAKKKAVINVMNHDNRCFEWAILSCLYPLEDNPHRVTKYIQYENTLKFDGIAFPVQPKDIPKFEKQNPSISVNVVSLDPENKGFCIEYLSLERHRLHHVNLLLLSDSETSHYVWIKNFSRLVHDRTKHTGGGASFVCNSCLNVFSSQ